MVESQKHKGRCKDLFINFFIILFLRICVSMSTTAARSPTSASTQQLEVEKLLNQLNKPSLHTIQSPDGDIIDCIHISQQPALNHPFLKDHKIQMSPTYYPEGTFDENKMSTTTESIQRETTITQLWHMNGRCPDDTIPVRRTRKDDILRAGSVKGFGKKHITKSRPNTTDVRRGHEYAIARVKGDKYYGARAAINVWQPKVQLNNEFSLSQIWVVAGSYDNLNTIEAGWQVYQQFYGDNNPRLFIYWTSDSYYSTGCYNLLCSGFVQISNNIAMGGSISPVSSTDDTQYAMDILIWQDREKGNWWMRWGDHTWLGYWPSSLFSHLSDGASTIDWGGEIVNAEPNGHHTRTQMGSGKFPEEGYGKASYFRNLQVVDESNHYQTPKALSTITDPSKYCYNIQTGTTYKGWGQYFFYGGPGLNRNCP